MWFYFFKNNIYNNDSCKYILKGSFFRFKVESSQKAEKLEESSGVRWLMCSRIRWRENHQRCSSESNDSRRYAGSVKRGIRNFPEVRVLGRTKENTYHCTTLGNFKILWNTFSVSQDSEKNQWNQKWGQTQTNYNQKSTELINFEARIPKIMEKCFSNIE